MACLGSSSTRKQRHPWQPQKPSPSRFFSVRAPPVPEALVHPLSKPGANSTTNRCLCRLRLFEDPPAPEAQKKLSPLLQRRLTHTTSVAHAESERHPSESVLSRHAHRVPRRYPRSDHPTSTASSFQHNPRGGMMTSFCRRACPEGPFIHAVGPPTSRPCLSTYETSFAFCFASPPPRTSLSPT